jgi:MFS family permease
VLERTPGVASTIRPSQRSLRGLDWFLFFVADVLTGFGPFVSIYLTAQHWTQLDIGLVLSTAAVVALLGQVPGGALVDAARSERLAAGLAITAIGCAALAIAAWPIFLVVEAAAVVQAAAACVLGPAIAAMSLGLVGHAALGERLGRNARFASLGTGLAALAMGASGYLLSNQAVFFVTAAFVLPAVFALSRIRENEIDPDRAHGAPDNGIAEPHARPIGLIALLGRRPLVVFACAMLLFQLANAAMLPLMASVLTMRSSQWATVLIAACIVVPQFLVALAAPWVGRRAQLHGRRPLLLLGFAMVPIRGVLFATVTDPYLLVAVQLLDGITASVFSVLTAFTVADVARGTGRFNLSLGIVGTASGIGASLSTTLAGYVTDHFGSPAAFFGLAAIAAAGLVLVWILMPETAETKPHRFPGGAHGSTRPE